MNAKMSSKFKPISRLSVVFILAVVISGGILTWFSINSISNQKELTEKRILEEQQELAVRFTIAIQDKIEQATEGFETDINPFLTMKDSLIKKAAEFDFIQLSFILNNTGIFLYPNFVRMFENQYKTNHSNAFNSAFRKGEEAEFKNVNIKAAKMQYIMCLHYSHGANDSVKSLNALSRISVKLNEYENAIEQYRLIVTKYFTIKNKDGFPYVYYALPQLLLITDPDNGEIILPVVKLFLEKMESGLIPLNYSTEELLTSITSWIHENSFNHPKEIIPVNELIVSINKQVQFVDNYQNELSEIIKKGKVDNHLNSTNGFKVVNSFSGRNEDLLLININLKNPSGFLIKRELLFESVLNKNLQTGFEFDYQIEFPDGYNPSVNGQNLVYSLQLNPYFPGQRIKLRLKDENLINEFIERRSWIYGIASLLLLVAMMLGVALTLRDIAREKHLARLQADFISNVTHELKTPLTSIYMFAELLLLDRVKLEKVRKEYLSIILKESDRLKRMINNILEFSKIGKGKPEYHFVHSKLAAVIDATIQDMNYWLEKEGFDVVTELDESIVTDLDCEKMRQALGNLLSNAIKYSIDTRKIHIRLYSKANQIYIEFEDHGIGINEDQLSRIFEKFYRIDQKESISGTGLGLTVVKEIIEAHKGKIRVVSEIGKGSIFSVILNK